MIVGKKLNTGACKSAGAISALILKKKLVVLTIYMIKKCRKINVVYI